LKETKCKPRFPKIFKKVSEESTLTHQTSITIPVAANRLQRAASNHKNKTRRFYFYKEPNKLRDCDLSKTAQMQAGDCQEVKPNFNLKEDTEQGREQ